MTQSSFASSQEKAVQSMTCATRFDYLYKVFYEGARDRKGATRRYLLPAPLDEVYSSAQVIGDIANIRNFLFHSHGQPTDDERPNKDYREAGDIVEARIKKRDLSSDDDRKRFRQILIAELAQLLRRVHEDLDDFNPAKSSPL